jgi:hypothetical protein
MRASVLSLALAGAGLVACVPVEGASEAEPELGSSQAALVNATDVVPNSEPWAARILEAGDDACTGTLIDPEWVLTAGHCIANKTMAELTVMLGDVSRFDAEDNEQWRQVVQVITAPGFRGHPHYRNDVGLLKLDRPAEINAWVQTADLSDDTPSVGTYGVGWGDLDMQQNQSDFLQRGSMSVLPNAQCNSSTAMASYEFCAGGGSSPNMTTTCFRDSGGPLLTYGRRRVVGVASWNTHACIGDRPAGYMRVSSFKSWIIQKIGHNPRRDVRMTWSGPGTSGWIYLYCDRTQKGAWANTSVPGTEISIDCPDSWVWMECDITNEANPQRSIQAIQRQVGLGQIEVVEDLPGRKGQWYDHAAGEIGAYDCKIN